MADMKTANVKRKYDIDSEFLQWSTTQFNIFRRFCVKKGDQISDQCEGPIIGDGYEACTLGLWDPDTMLVYQDIPDFMPPPCDDQRMSGVEIMTEDSAQDNKIKLAFKKVKSFKILCV